MPAMQQRSRGQATRKMSRKTGVARKTLATSAVGSYFKDEQHVESLVKDHQAFQQVVSELIGYAEKDHAQAETEVEYGEALYNLLKLPIESQKPIVWAIATANKVAKPDYPAEDQIRGRGRPQTGRKQLAEALYGRWPDMLTLEGQNKDTRAGMQITDHKRRYMIRAGLLTESPSKTKVGQVSRRVLRKSFEALWSVAKTDKEQKLLTALFGRLGVEETEMTVWEDEALTESAEPAPAA